MLSADLWSCKLMAAPCHFHKALFIFLGLPELKQFAYVETLAGVRHLVTYFVVTEKKKSRFGGIFSSLRGEGEEMDGKT